MYMLREENACSHVFASCLESHGHYSEKDENSRDSLPLCSAVAVESNAGAVTVRYEFKDGNAVILHIDKELTML